MVYDEGPTYPLTFRAMAEDIWEGKQPEGQVYVYIAKFVLHSVFCR